VNSPVTAAPFIRPHLPSPLRPVAAPARQEIIDYLAACTK